MELRSGACLSRADEVRQQLLQATTLPPLPVVARPAFEEGVRLLFARWTALRIAVDEENTASKEDEEYLLQKTIQYFYTTNGVCMAGVVAGVRCTCVSLGLEPAHWAEAQKLSLRFLHAHYTSTTF